MNFKEDAFKLIDEVSGLKTEDVKLDENHITNVDKIDLVLEDLNLEIENIKPKIKTNKNVESKPKVIEENSEDFYQPIQKKSDFKFIGKLYEAPNPLEYEEGTIYKNTRSGITYIKSGDLWESLVEDGKPGVQGPQGRVGGSGAGVKEVENIVDTKITTTSQLLSSTDDQITYVGTQAGWNERILFQKYFGTSVNDNAQTVILASASGISAIDGNYPNSLYGIPPMIRANFLNNKHKWIKSHFMFGLNLGNTSGAYYLIDEYWGDTKMCTITADYNYFPSPPTSAQNFPMEVFIWYNWDSGPASAAKIRVHMQMTANNVVSYDSVIRNKETYTGDYPIVDLTKDLAISWTAKCNLNNRKLYVDTLEYVA